MIVWTFAIVALFFITLGMALMNVAPTRDLARLGFWMIGIGSLAGLCAGAAAIFGGP